MRYVVTGGAGFIGSNTVEELVRRGHSVVVLDDLSSGKEENLAEVRNVSSRLAVLDRGRMIAEGAPGDVLGRDDVRQAYIGEKKAAHA